MGPIVTSIEARTCGLCQFMAAEFQAFQRLLHTLQRDVIRGCIAFRIRVRFSETPESGVNSIHIFVRHTRRSFENLKTEQGAQNCSVLSEDHHRSALSAWAVGKSRVENNVDISMFALGYTYIGRGFMAVTVTAPRP